MNRAIPLIHSALIAGSTVFCSMLPLVAQEKISEIAPAIHAARPEFDPWQLPVDHLVDTTKPPEVPEGCVNYAEALLAAEAMLESIGKGFGLPATPSLILPAEDAPKPKYPILLARDAEGNPSIYYFPLRVGNDIGHVAIAATKNLFPLVSSSIDWHPLNSLVKIVDDLDTPAAPVTVKIFAFEMGQPIFDVRSKLYVPNQVEPIERNQLNLFQQNYRNVCEQLGQKAKLEWDTLLQPKQNLKLESRTSDFSTRSTNTSASISVPNYSWYRGCSTTALSMMLSYWAKDYSEFGEAPTSFQWTQPSGKIITRYIGGIFDITSWQCDGPQTVFITRNIADALANNMGITKDCGTGLSPFDNDFGSYASQQSTAVKAISRALGQPMGSHVLNGSDIDIAKFELDSGRPVKWGHDVRAYQTRDGVHSVPLSGYSESPNGASTTLFFNTTWDTTLTANYETAVAGGHSFNFVTMLPPATRYMALVIDSSGSNTSTDPNDRRISAAKLTAQRMNSESEAASDPNLVPDKVAVIDFDSSAKVLAGFGDPDAVESSIDQIDSSGGTDIAAGINKAIELYEAEGVNGICNYASIVILSDFKNNAGDLPVRSAIKKAEEMGIRVFQGFLNPTGPSSSRNASVEAAEDDVITNQLVAKSQSKNTSALSSTVEQAILDTGGFFATISNADSLISFVDQLFIQGVTHSDPTREEEQRKLLGNLLLVSSLKAQVFTPEDPLGYDPAAKAERTFVFSAKAGEAVSVRVTNAAFTPVLEVNDSSNQVLADNKNESFSRSIAGNFVAPADGSYSVDVGSKDGSTGLFEIFVDVENNNLGISAVSPTKLDINSLGGIVRMPLTISEISGINDLTSVSLTVTGGTFKLAPQTSFSINNFNVSAGGNRVVEVTINTTSLNVSDFAGAAINVTSLGNQASLIPLNLSQIGRIKSVGDLRLNPQTGLYEQLISIENTTGAELSGFRMYLDGLAATTRLQNAHGMVEGRPYVDYRNLLGQGASVTLTLEYYVSDRKAPITPNFVLVAVGDPPPEPDASLAISLNPRLTVGENKDILLEFVSRMSKTYTIQYSFDLITWKTVPSVISGTGNKVQWLDNGPPKTECHPSECPSRYYRLIER